MADKIWILIPHHGYEGYGEPQMAFKTQEKAAAAKALIDKTLSAPEIKIIEVDVWSFD